MNKGTSIPKGGRPRYEPDKDDLALVKKLVSSGLTVESITQVLDISRTTYYELIARDKNFSDTIKKGRAYDYLACDEAVKQNNLSPTTYIYFSKTKWKDFYPQEDREVQPQKVEVNLTDEQAMKILEIAGQDGAPV